MHFLGSTIVLIGIHAFHNNVQTILEGRCIRNKLFLIDCRYNYLLIIYDPNSVRSESLWSFLSKKEYAIDTNNIISFDRVVLLCIIVLFR
jgi:hypothetical protein